MPLGDWLAYLTWARRQLAEEGTASAGLLEAMQKREAKETLGILTTIFRFSSIKANKEMIGRLRRLGYYPIRRECDWAGRGRVVARGLISRRAGCHFARQRGKHDMIPLANAECAGAGDGDAHT